MRKILLIFIFLSVFSLNGFSQSNWSLKGGLTLSYFTDADNSSPNYGFTLCLARKFNLKWNFSLSGEIDFAIRSATLNNTPIEPYESYNKSDAYLWNIHLKLGFVDIPFLLQYSFPLGSKANFILYTGPSFSIPILDFSDIEKKKFYEEYDPNNPNSSEYNYWFGDGEENSAFWSNDKKIIYNFGINLSYLKYIIEFRYILDTRNVYRIDNISDIHHGMNSVYLLVGIGL